ncbi:hypothetical protein CC80DRAFT_497309 [Byssothecium circinans]|uniref:Uncharacterized protein n=1 Tax=Byssothecium circinans TaxID=147558 RepID=A0A6A5TAN1_9PLEO|nr:hypothetical protein CC80DRAFT_497309 [Byssothecium circinans]
MGSRQSHPVGSALALPEITDSRDLFVKDTTLEDEHGQATSVDTRMPDREETTVALTASCSPSHSLMLPSENASDTLPTASDSNEPINTIMNNVADTPPPWSSQAERYTKFSASPS